MATRLEDEFDPTRINAPDAAYPAGSLKDETTPGVSDDGTPLASRVGNDWQGFSQSVLDKAGIAANGQPDSVSNPQILQAIEQMYNEGDSQLAGGNIWPLSSQESAQVGDAGLIDVLYLRDSAAGRVYMLSQPVSGEITSLDFSLFTATVGGVDVTLSRLNNNLRDDITTQNAVNESVAMKSDILMGGDFKANGNVDFSGALMDLRNGRFELISSTQLRALSSGLGTIQSGTFYPSISLSAGIRIGSELNTVKDLTFDNSDEVGFNQVLWLRTMKYFRSSNNNFIKTGYQHIQESGEPADMVLVNGCISVDTTRDFVLPNNDFNDGVSYGWSVVNNIIDQTNSSEPFGVTESRAIGFTSTYGGLALGNVMVSVKGDAASHIENIQESSFIGNYYRDCFKGLLYSGNSDRLLILLENQSGTVSVGDTITSSSGGSATVQFILQDNQLIKVINVTGSFNEGDGYLVSGGAVASGDIAYVDRVLTHSNQIGNIYHTTIDEAGNGLSIGGNNYTIRAHSIGNIYNNQYNQGVDKFAVGASFVSDYVFQNETFRGWGVAIGGGGSLIGAKINECLFWANGSNMECTALRDSSLNGNIFYDGNMNLSGVESTDFIGNKWKSGTVVISATSNTGNRWINNTVDSSVVNMTIDTSQFDEWESETFSKKRGRSVITREDSLSNATPEILLGTIPGVSWGAAAIDWSISYRSPTGSSKCEIGRAIINWDGATTPTITNDPANFSNGGSAGAIDIRISGNDVEIYTTQNAAGFNVNASNSITVTSSNVNLLPTSFL